jgi:Zn-dependent protease
MGGENTILFYVIFIPHMLLALSLHEASHAGAALMMGDDTATRMGRLTLNPLKHLDPLGVLAFMIVHFGWAKPVPVNLLRLRNPRRDNMLIGLAGPASNLALGVLLLAGIRTVYLIGPVTDDLMMTVVAFLFVGAQLNIGLCFFNLIPIPPLDGSHILLGLVPERVADEIEPMFRYGGILLLFLVFGSRYLGFSVIGVLIGRPMAWVMKTIATPEVLADVFRCLIEFKLI